MHNRRKWKKRLSVLFVMLCLLFSLIPIYWMLNTSFKSMSEIYRADPTLIPEKPTVENYVSLFTKTGFLRGVWNSLLVALVVSSFSISVAFPAAYAVSRLVFKGKRIMSRGILFCYLIPASVLYIPLFVMLSKIGLTNSIVGLMVIYPTATIPYAAWMLIPNIRSVPKNIEEAAMVDGCSRGQVITKVALPLCMPSIISTFIFTFGMSWGEYMYALANISSESSKTFPLILSGLIFGDMYPWGQLMAGGICASIPLIVTYVCLSKFLITGATEGGVKG